MKLEELLIDENIDQVMALNTRFEVMVWNKACEAATGINREEIINRSIFDFFPDMQGNQLVGDALQAALKGYRSFVPHSRSLSDAHYVEQHFIPLKDDAGKVIGILNVTHDVADRIKAENELRALNKSLKNFKRVIDSTHDIVITFDVDGLITYWNKSAERLYGYKAEEILGESLSCLLPESMKNEVAVMLEELRNDTAIDAVRKHRTRSGSEIDVAINMFPLFGENREFTGGCKVGRDITEILKYQKNIEALNNELTIKNRQLAALHLELNTFTNIAVNNYSETLRQLYLHFEYIMANEARKLSDPGKANIRKAQVAIQKMRLLTSDISSFMRLNELDNELKPVDLDAVIRTVIDDLKDKAGTDASFVIDSLPTITGYPSLVSLIFHHLLENAVKFRKDNEPLVVTISCRRNVDGSAIKDGGVHPGASYDVVTVKDNGEGFPQEEAEHMFQIFTRLEPGKYKGFGIGLAICRKAMELHHGGITTESAPGAGSSFSCYFPVR